MSLEADRPLQVGGMFVRGLRARLVRGFSWNLVATVFSQGSTLVVNVILANVWGVRVFGEFAIVQSTLATLTAVAQPTTGAAATKYVAETRTQDPARAGRVLGLCAAVSVCLAAIVGATLFLASHTMAARILHAPGLATALQAAAVAVVFTIMSGFLSGALAGLESYPALGKAGILSGVLYVAFTAALGTAWGLVGAVWGLAVSACIQWITLLVAVWSEAARHGIRVAPREGSRELSVLFRFVAPAACNGLVASPAVWVTNALLVRNQGYQQMALFAAANSLRILVLIVPSILSNVSLSLLSHQRGAADERRYRRLFWANLAITTSLVAVGGVGVAVAAPWLLDLFGDGFRAGHSALLILMLATVPEIVALSMLHILQSRERMWLSFFAVVFPSYLALVVAARLVTPAHGAQGLAWSYVAAMSVALACSVSVVARVRLWDRNFVASAGTP